MCVKSIVLVFFNPFEPSFSILTFIFWFHSRNLPFLSLSSFQDFINGSQTNSSSIKFEKGESSKYRAWNPKPDNSFTSRFFRGSKKFGLNIIVLLGDALIFLNIVHYLLLTFLTTISSCSKILMLFLPSFKQLRESC